MSTKERFKNAKRTVKAVEVFGETFHIRALTLRELNALDEHAEGTEGTERSYRYAVGMFAAAVCEADGKAVYGGPTDPDISDVPGDYFRELNKAAFALNGMEGDAEGND